MSMIIGKSVDVEAYDKDGNKLENVCRIEKPEIFKKRSKDEAEGDSEKEKKLNKDLMLTDSTSDSSDTIESAPSEIPNVDTVDVTTVE